MPRKSSQATYRDEKARAKKERGLPHEELIASAKKEFERVLAAGQAARKRGRPKKTATPPADPDAILDDLDDK